jgi:stage II sporulation protein D
MDQLLEKGTESMLQRYVLICLITAFYLSLPGSLMADDISHSLSDAERYLNNGNYLEAMGTYQEMVDKTSDPDLKAKIILKIGDIYSQILNNYEKALEYYDILQKRYPGSPHAAMAYFNAGMILYQNDFYPEALRQFKAYCEKYPRGEKRDAAEFLIDQCSRQTPQPEKKAASTIWADENIRVLLMTSVRTVQVDALSLFNILDITEKDVLTTHRSIVVQSDRTSITINDDRLTLDGIVISPPAGEALSLNGNPYQGRLRIQINPKGGIDVVNILPLEAYLYGVIPKEMPHQWFSEALKAQAIAARTYALYHMEKNRHRPYDMTATTDCQVYGGLSAERESSNRAVDDTRGIVLTYKDQLVLAYFHAHSGGVTEDARRIWKAEIPYLKSVQDHYSSKAPNNIWRQTFSLDEIRKMLNKGAGDFGPIKKISPHEMSPTGRLIRIKILHGKRETVMNAYDFRMKMDPVLIKSTFFDIVQTGQDVTFAGKGYGHGVGMSQWGAYVMAGEGFTWPEILQYYYQDVDIRKL